MDRRHFLRLIGLGGIAVSMPRILLAEPTPGDPLWIHVQATGGWDPALTVDPKPALRKGANRALYVFPATLVNNGVISSGQATLDPAALIELRTSPGGGFPYLGFADMNASADPNFPWKPFLPTYADRITIFNGIDTATINHVVGIRYCATGSSNESFPVFATQVAYARSPDLPLSFLNLGGYAETAGLLAGQPLGGASLGSLARVVGPNDLSGDNAGGDPILSSRALSLVDAAHAKRLARLSASATLPSHKSAIDRLSRVEGGISALTSLRFNAGDQSLANAIRVGLDTYRNGLSAAIGLEVGGFDSHGNNEQTQVLAVNNLFETIRLILTETETPSGGKSAIPAVVVVTSDFGRSPYYRNGGTDHWPATSMMVVQNSLAKKLNLAIPTNTVIGATSDGDELTGMRPVKINPQTFKRDDVNGVILTPGHVMRALRRLAKIDASKAMAAWPLTVDKDLAIG